MISSIKQRGDTIVEVLIAMAVLGSVLVGSISIANKSLLRIQMAQERTGAQKVAQQSVEKMSRLVLLDPSNVNPATPVPDFCIKSDYTKQTSPTTNALCKDGIYTTVISRSITSPDNLVTFNIAVTWDSLNGTTENVTINYRVRQ